jgi:hypothetical protein
MIISSMHEQIQNNFKELTKSLQLGGRIKLQTGLYNEY